MKTLFPGWCLLVFFCVFSISAQEKTDLKEIRFSDKEPLSHIRDVQYCENPKFTPPPADISEKAILKKPLVDFSADPAAWKARLFNCDGFLCLSLDQAVRKQPNLKLELTSKQAGAKAELVPEKPLKTSRAFDTFMLLGYAKNLTVITVKFRKPDGKLFTWQSRKNNFNEVLTGWNLLRIPLKKRLPAGTALVSIGFETIRFRANHDPDLWHLKQFDVVMGSDHLKQPPYRFDTGEIVKIPVSPAGSRPVPGEAVKYRVWQDGNSFKLCYMNAEGIGATYIYRPEKGTLEDVSIRCGSGKEFRPAAESGPVFTVKGKDFDIRKDGQVKPELLKCELKSGQVSAVWNYRFGNSTQKIAWKLRIEGKSLVVDLDSGERFLKEWATGYASGTSPDAKIFAVPFMDHFPNILWNDGWFLSHFHDHYKGSFSIHSYEGGTRVLPDKAFYHFIQIGYCYNPRSDGSRHPLRETVYITAAKKFDEVLINPSHPKSPYREMMSNNLYKRFEVRSNIYRKAKKLTDLYDQYGVNHLFFDIFGFIWTSGLWGSGETAFHAGHPSYIHQKGDDQAFCAALEDLRKKQMIPGYYETYNALQVRSTLWDPAKIGIRSDGSWHQDNVQAYMHKMWALPEWERGFFKARNRKYQPRRTGYVDGFTSRLPFMYNDYDHRYPESGKMIDTIRAIATGFQRIRENYQGPVFAEGRGSDFYWAGLNDGDYGKLAGFGHWLKPRKARYPLLVDFRLKKLNPLAPAWGLNIGYSMFCGNRWYLTNDYSLLYHYLAMNIAYGTVGFIEPCGDAYPNPHKHFDKTLETYYLVRQLQKRYLMQPVKTIRYFDGTKLVPTEEALVSGKYRDNMLFIEYENGLEIYINCNWDDRNWEINVEGKKYLLPSGGWFARQGKDFLEYSILQNGSRVSYVDSPEYRYLNGYDRKIEVDGITSDRILIQYKTGPKKGETLLYPPVSGNRSR